MRIYMAGPLFTIGEKMFNERLCKDLRDKGYEVILPQEFPVTLGTTAFDLFKKCSNNAISCDIILANMDGADPDSGTAWEVSAAYHFQIPVILYRTDSRSANDFGDSPFNLMLSQCARTIILEQDYEKLLNGIVDNLMGLANLWAI